ncbi:hypothetical protein J3D46_001883 [Paenarthrobacter sp. A20]|nr:hypothetical protein [Paenarthrobacter sp. A20]
MLNMVVLNAAPKKPPFRCGVTYPMTDANQPVWSGTSQ